MADLPNIDFNRMEIPKLPRGGLKAIIAVLVVVVAAFSTLYQVQPQYGIVDLCVTCLSHLKSREPL